METFDSSVLVALITGLCAVVGNAIVSRTDRRKADQERAVKDAKVEMRLESIETKLDVHNGYAEKFSDISVLIAEIRTELKAIKEGLMNR